MVKILTHIDMESSRANLFKEAGFCEDDFYVKDEKGNFVLTDNEKTPIPFYLSADEFMRDENSSNTSTVPIPNIRETGVKADAVSEVSAYAPENSVFYPMDNGLKGYGAGIMLKDLGGDIPESELIDPVSFTISPNTDIRFSIYQNYFGSYSTDCNKNFMNSLLVQIDEPWNYEGETPKPLIRNILSDTRAISVPSTGTQPFRMHHLIGLLEGDYSLSAFFRHTASSDAIISNFQIIPQDGGAISNLETLTSLEASGNSFKVPSRWKDHAVTFHATEGVYDVVLDWTGKTVGDSLRITGIQLEETPYPQVFCSRQIKKKDAPYTVHPLLFDFEQGVANPMQRRFAISYKRYLRMNIHKNTQYDTLGNIKYGFDNNNIIIGEQRLPFPDGYNPTCKWERVTIANDPITKTLDFWSTGKTWDIKIGSYKYRDVSELTADVDGMPVNLSLGFYPQGINGNRFLTTSAYKDLGYYADTYELSKVKNSYMALSLTDKGDSVIRSFDWEEEY